VQYLENAFLIHKVGRYDIVGKRIFEVGDKYNIENLGIRNGILGYRIEDRGKILENVVYNHLVYSGYKVTVGKLDSAEIDFIAERNGEKQYLQVALTIYDAATLEREFGNLIN
jgi:predicted AAA+ superfamily ATPase